MDRPRQFPLGKYRGLTFGIERQPGGSADLYLEGQGIRKTMLSDDSQGARAVQKVLAGLRGLRTVVDSVD